MSSKVKIVLSQEEAIVLFEFLSELDENNLIKRKCDKRIVWDIICMIEKNSEFLINNPKYKEQLEKARTKLATSVLIKGVKS